MAETTKRPRSSSPGVSDNGDNPKLNKKAKEEETSGGSSEEVKKAQNQDQEAMAAAPKEENVPAPTETEAVEAPAATGTDAAGTEDNTESKPAGEGEEAAVDNGLPQPATGEEQPQSIAMRCIILSTEASIIIGKQGKNINDIRDRSGAKLTIVSVGDGSETNEKVIGFRKWISTGIKDLSEVQWS